MEMEALVLRAQNGDDEAFVTLISQHKERLYRIAYSYVKDQHEALEAIQETTYRAYMNLKKLKQPQFFYTWIIRILINYCIDVQQRQKKVLPLLTFQGAQEEIPPFDHKVELELAIKRLKPKYQHVIILKYFQGLTLKEIADVLQQPEGTIKTWLNKALKELRTTIQSDGGWEYAWETR